MSGESTIAIAWKLGENALVNGGRAVNQGSFIEAPKIANPGAAGLFLTTLRAKAEPMPPLCGAEVFAARSQCYIGAMRFEPTSVVRLTWALKLS